MSEKKLTNEELKQVTGGDSKAPRVYTDWKKVYSYLQEHKNELPEVLRLEFESFDDEHSPYFQYFVKENAKTNEVVRTAYNYGAVIVPR